MFIKAVKGSATLVTCVAALAFAGPAHAQDDLGSYTTPTDVTTTPTGTTGEATGDTPGTGGNAGNGSTGTGGGTAGVKSGSSGVKPGRASGGVAGASSSGGTTAGGANAASASLAAGSAPRQLAFTGAEPLVIGGFGLLLMGLAVVLQRRRGAAGRMR